MYSHLRVKDGLVAFVPNDPTEVSYVAENISLKLLQPQYN